MHVALNLTAVLADLGRHREALEMAHEAVEDLRRDAVERGEAPQASLLSRIECEDDAGDSDVLGKLLRSTVPQVARLQHQSWMDTAGVIFLISGNASVTESHGGLDQRFGDDLVKFEAGCVAENLALQATSLGLDRVLLTEWAGNLYLNLDQTSDLTISDAMIPGPTTLNNWPLSTLKVRHRMQFDIRCNWKIFWENYLECYHCPGIHPELCRIVPLYQAGLATDHLKSGFKGEDRVANGVESWPETGRAIAPTLEGLSKAEVKAGHTFLEIYPNQYIVAHPDYVRQVSILPSAPGVTRVTKRSWRDCKRRLRL